MRILVTGCAGFIGHHLVKKLLDQGHRVIGLDNFDPFYDLVIKQKRVQLLEKSDHFYFYLLDLRSSLLSLPEVDLVIHLAAKVGVRDSIYKAQEYQDHNVSGLKNLLEWMKENANPTLINISSSSVYGKVAGPILLNETQPCQPLNPYAKSKVDAENLIEKYTEIKSIHLRLFSVYGPGQRPDLLFPTLKDCIKYKSEFTVYGDGSSSRDYTHVNDVVQAIQLLIQRLLGLESGTKFNIGTGQPYKIAEVIQWIQQKSELKVKYQSAFNYEMSHTFADISLAEKRLGYQPQEDLKTYLHEQICNLN